MRKKGTYGKRGASGEAHTGGGGMEAVDTEAESERHDHRKPHPPRIAAPAAVPGIGQGLKQRFPGGTVESERGSLSSATW